MLLKALILFALSNGVFAATYLVAVIPPPGGFTNVSLVGINNAGQFAGTGTLGSTPQAFIESLSGSSAIPLPPGWVSAVGVAINDTGQVAGYGNNGSTNQSFIGSASGSTPIPLPPGSSFAFAQAVNNSGQVVGRGENMAFIGTISGSTSIPLPPGWTTSVGYAVNASGQVTGAVVNSTSQAYIGTTSVSVAIPFLPGWFFTQGEGINDLGQVAGWGNFGSVGRAFVATGTQMTAIPPPIGSTNTFVQGRSIDNQGTVIGGSSAGGWIWDATNGTRLLNNLLPAGWDAVPISISNNGLILAQASLNGGASQFVELSPAPLPPTPAPSTLALFSIGAAFCLIWLRWNLGAKGRK
jgi:hypothetical protein